MTDVNKNIFEAYKSMYEEKMSPEECIRDTLRKEGGAAGLAPLDKALKDKGHDMSAKEVISKMSDVKQHKEGDYILDEDASNDKSDDGEGLDKVDPKAVKKKFKDRKDQDIDNDGDVDSSDEYLHKRRKAVSKAVSNESFTVDDIRAMCHSKDHDCATYVDHPEFGLGKPVYESHAIPDENGHVAWYDVEFAHGIEEQVPAEDMQILQTEAHNGNGKKPMKKKEPIEDDTVINVDNDEEEAPQMDSDEKPMKKKKPPMPPKKDNGEKEDDVEEPEDDGKDVKIISKDKKKKNGNGNGNGKTAEISKIGEEVSQFTSLLNELSGVDAVGKKKKEKDGSEPDAEYGNQTDTAEKEKEFKDAHGKKDVAVDVDDAIKQTTKTAQDTKKGKHVKGQTAKGDTKPIKSTEAPVKDKEVKDGEGKKSIKTESTLMDLAVQALKGKTVPEMKQIIASKEAPKNPFDARTKDAKAFLERMAKRKNGENGQYKDKDPKDLPMIKSAYHGKKKKGDK